MNKTDKNVEESLDHDRPFYELAKHKISLIPFPVSNIRRIMSIAKLFNHYRLTHSSEEVTIALEDIKRDAKKKLLQKLEDTLNVPLAGRSMIDQNSKNSIFSSYDQLSDEEKYLYDIRQKIGIISQIKREGVVKTSKKNVSRYTDYILSFTDTSDEKLNEEIEVLRNNLTLC